MSALIPTPPGWQADLAAAAAERFARDRRRPWPNDQYRDDIVGFCDDMLGYTPFEGKSGQRRWMEEAIKPGAWVSVSGSHKMGKTKGIADCILQQWCSWDEIRIVIFAPKQEHVEKALWPELRKSYMRAGRCDWCVAGLCAHCASDPLLHGRCDRCESKGLELPPCIWCDPVGDPEWWSDDVTKGLRSPNRKRWIHYYYSKSKDGKGGLSAPRMIFVFEETGGIKRELIDAMKGNAAGGVSWWQNGNPLHDTGWFRDCHYGRKKKLFSHTAEVSALDSPNVTDNANIPGIATKAWIDRCASDWGTKSVIYQQRVVGKPPKYHPGQLLRLEELQRSFKRHGSPKCHFHGRLQIGVDIAFSGDLAVLAPRRGRRIDKLLLLDEDNEVDLAHRVWNEARELRRPHERKPLVVYDRTGDVGARFHREIQRYAEELDLVGILAMAPPKDKQRFYQRRDELIAGLAAFIRHSRGALPEDELLEGEIMILHGRAVSRNDRRTCYQTNDELRELIDRSPDRRNACELAVANVEDSDGLGDPNLGPADAAPLTANELAAGEPPKPPPRRAPVAERRRPEQPRRQYRYGAADAGMAAAWGRS